VTRESRNSWPVHDALRTAADSVSPAVFSLLPSTDGGPALTAFLVDGEGHALTTVNHLEGRTEFTAVFPSGVEAKAVLLGEDERTEVALLKVTGERLPKPPVLVSEVPRLGSFVVALGNPNGRDLESGSLLTMGIVGGRGRSAVGGEEARYAAIHTDAAVNRGNIGGPLVDLSGRVVGVLSSLRGQSLTGVGSNSGVGFAIPMPSILTRMDRLKRGGKVAYVPGRLGIRISLDPVAGGGVEVLAVMPDGPAEAVGILAGDVVVGANGEAIANHLDLRRIFGEFQAGQDLTVSVRRGAETLTFTATLIPR
jgi:S1-C subfamily serine protease